MSGSRHTMSPADGDGDPAACGLLARLGPHARADLLTLGVTRTHVSHEVLLREGDRSQHVILLLAGRVKVITTAPTGYEAVLAIRGPGDIVGELACIDHLPRSATVVTLEATRTRVVPGQVFEDFLTDHPSAHRVLTRMVAGRLRAATRRRLEFGAYPVRRRLALVLLDLDEWYGRDVPGGRDIDLVLSQADLSGLVGASLEAVSQAVRSLVRDGVIATRRRHITIVQPEGLRSLTADGPASIR